MQLDQIKTKLLSCAIGELGKFHRFNLRLDAKVSPLAFVLGFFQAFSQGYSLRLWACGVSTQLLGQCISKAGLQSRFTERSKRFCLSLLGRILRHHYFQPLSRLNLDKGYLSSFSRVYVVDSTCISLSPVLAPLFPGSHSSRGQAATARLQVCMELTQEVFRYFRLGSFRHNDQSHSGAIMEFLEAGDLVLRDMGYWSLKVFQQIVARQAYFLSRFRYGTNLYDAQSGEQLDLIKLLKRSRNRQLSYLDMNIKLGKKAQLPCRLIARELPPEIANQRIRKARKERNAKANHSKAYYEHLRFNIFITNVEAEVWQSQAALQVYGLRWRIEILFKVWKSRFGLKRILAESKIVKANHVYIFLYLFLAYVTMVHLRYYQYFLYTVFRSTRKYLSLNLFADFVRANLEQLDRAEAQNQLNELTDQLAQFFTHEKRKGRPPLLQGLFPLEVST